MTSNGVPQPKSALAALTPIERLILTSFRRALTNVDVLKKNAVSLLFRALVVVASFRILRSLGRASSSAVRAVRPDRLSPELRRLLSSLELAQYTTTLESKGYTWIEDLAFIDLEDFLNDTGEIRSVSLSLAGHPNCNTTLSIQLMSANG